MAAGSLGHLRTREGPAVPGIQRPSTPGASDGPAGRMTVQAGNHGAGRPEHLRRYRCERDGTSDAHPRGADDACRRVFGTIGPMLSELTDAQVASGFRRE